VLASLVFDQLVGLTIACVFAIHERRLDILLTFPLHLVIRTLNCTLLLRTFWKELIRQETLRVWFTVPRYTHAHSALTVEDANA
jgi:hypothetical protein